MNSIAKKIIETRKLKGLTQEELAEQSQVNLRTIQRIENSESEPRGKTLTLICDALQINIQELVMGDKNGDSIKLASKITNGLFLLALNLILMSVIGFLTLDSNANVNSRLGAFLLSIFMPLFIVILTKKMNGIERMLKFGFGFIIYFFLVTISNGFPIGFTTGLIPCLLLALSVLYFGHELIRNREV